MLPGMAAHLNREDEDHLSEMAVWTGARSWVHKNLTGHNHHNHLPPDFLCVKGKSLLSYLASITFQASQVAQGQESSCQCRRHRFNPWVRKISWRRKWQPDPAFFPGESHGQRNLVGNNPWGRKELDTTQQLNNNNNSGFPEPDPNSELDTANRV